MRACRWLSLVGVIVPTLLGIPAWAQTASVRTTKKHFTKFDVASVRETKTDDPIYMNFPLGPTDMYVRNSGYFHANLWLDSYIAFAYKMNGPQIAVLHQSEPSWVNSTRYDIQAKVDGDPDKDDMRAMMRALLKERFHLEIHVETRKAAVFDMVLVKPGKAGPALMPHPESDPSCLLKAPDGFASPCGGVGVMPTSEHTRMKMAGRNISMGLLDGSIEGLAGRPVINKTGLLGKYDFTLEFVGDPTEAKAGETDDTFLEALTDQLGVKLIPDKGAAEIYVLDHIERPTEN